MAPRARGEGKTPHRHLRMEDDPWERFGHLAEPDRSTVIRQFVLWYIGEPGVKMPRRPRAEEPTT